MRVSRFTKKIVGGAITMHFQHFIVEERDEYIFHQSHVVLESAHEARRIIWSNTISNFHIVWHIVL